MLNKIVLAMVCLRLLSGTIEITAALIMWRLNEVGKALMVNTSLALVGPLILISTTAIGLVGMADRLSFSKLSWIVLGIACLFIGIAKK
ncbi:YqhV family protein [Marinicrinis sediminis]|uniref:YqhV family protein n=1 Tax=Marinicrinis sediminis TaxID=1652465 RepID=A0ABW5RCS1_9BACL